VVAIFFLKDDVGEVLAEVFIIDARAQAGAEIVFDGAEEAGADFAVSGEAEPIAMAAKRF